MNEEKLLNRWRMVAAALAMQACLGVLYAWSVFRPALMKEYGWSVKQAGYPYMTSLFVFALGMIVGGRWQDKVGPRKVAITGGLLLGLGAGLSGAIGHQLSGIIVAYGVLAGLGVGFAYVTPITTCIKWFPDMRGTITGLAVFGFGAGTLVFGPLINTLITRVGIPTTFYILGALFTAVVCASGSLFQVPSAGYRPANWTPPAATGVTKRANWTPREMAGSTQFWLLWVIYFFGAAAGLMIIGQAVPIGIEVAHLSKAVAAGGLGTMALFNGLGRLAWGSVSDRLGRLNTVLALFAGYLIAFLFILPKSDSFLTWVTGICLVGFCYGGYLALMPSITADFYGTRYLGANYGWLYTAWGAAGVGGPYLIDAIKTATGAFTNAMYAISAACVVGMLLVFIVRIPELEDRAPALEPNPEPVAK